MSASDDPRQVLRELCVHHNAMVLSSAPRIDRIDLHRIVNTVDVLDAYDRGKSIKELLWMLDS